MMENLVGQWQSLWISPTTCFNRMKIFALLLIVLIVGCSPAPSTKVEHWSYKSFQFVFENPLAWTRQSDGIESIKEPVAYLNLGQLLTRLDDRGWQFVWTDGNKTIVKTTFKNSQNNGFILFPPQ